MPHPDLPSAAETFLALTVDELAFARDAILNAVDDEDARLGPLWAAIEIRLGELAA